MSVHDLDTLFLAQEELRRWRAESENASARLELAKAKEARAALLSRHEPVAMLGIDREALRILLSFTVHCNPTLMLREVEAHLHGKSATERQQ